MSRSKDGSKRLTVGSRAVAVGVIAELLRAAEDNLGGIVIQNVPALADEIVDLAWDVEYKPTAERLVITIDAGVTSGDRMRSTPEDQPTEVGPASPA